VGEALRLDFDRRLTPHFRGSVAFAPLLIQKLAGDGFEGVGGRRTRRGFRHLFDEGGGLAIGQKAPRLFPRLSRLATAGSRLDADRPNVIASRDPA
jgi:hypothetical protein